MSVISSGKKIQLGPWIKHFEDQAKGGASVRSFINRHYIVVTGSGGGGKAEYCEASGGEELPPVVAAVEQGIEQAEEEVKREKVTNEKEKLVKDFGRSVQGNLCKKRRISDNLQRQKKCRKQRLIPHDIFS